MIIEWVCPLCGDSMITTGERQAPVCKYHGPGENPEMEFRGRRYSMAGFPAMKIAVDFDGTVVDQCYPRIGPDVPYAVVTLQELCKKHRIILNTMRSGKELSDAVRWMRENEITLFGIQSDPEQHGWTESMKCYADVHIDDRGFGMPLIKPPGFVRPCVDWLAVRKMFDM